MIVGEEPRDWLRPKSPSVASVVSAPAPVAVTPETALPEQLDAFRELLLTSADLPFVSPGAPRVCPAGDPGAGLMIMVDIPAAADCAAGSLVSGESGQLLDRMLAAIGRSRETVYLAALSCLRPADGRIAGEAATRCAALARHHIGLVAPKALLLFGDACSRALTGLPVAQARGRWHDVPTHAGPVRTIVTMTPDYLLRQPSAKALAWADLQMLARGLET